MMSVLKNNVPENIIEEFIRSWEGKNFSGIWAPETDRNEACLVGSTLSIGMDAAAHISGIVDYARRATKQYKAAGRTANPDDRVIEAGRVRTGGGSFTVIYASCSCVMWCSHLIQINSMH